MTRLIVYIAISLAIALAAAWLISMPGTIMIEFAGYRMQPGLGVTGAAILGLVILSIAIWAIVRRVLEAPRRVAKRVAARRQRVGLEMLGDGYIALQAGDPARARMLARDAQSRLPQNAAAQLLEAQAELTIGDLPSAREHYRALISNPKTALAALSGLFQQANAQGRPDAALTFARRATKLAPSLEWAQSAVLNDLTRNQDWIGALDALNAAPASSKEDKQQKRRAQAVLTTAIAIEAEPTDSDAAFENATAALKLHPNFVPAALIAGRVLINRGDTRKAQSLLRRVWRATGHPHVATLFANCLPGASAVERLKKVRELVESTEPSQPSACVLARAAIDAFEWAAARNALAPHATEKPTQLVCTLMAEIEEGQSGDHGKAREWLSRAVRAPRDPAWTANGIISDEWEPTSPVTGELDAFEWKVPVQISASDRLAAEPPAPAPQPAENEKQPDAPSQPAALPGAS